MLVSRRAHGAHHRAPFEGNYCIVSGIWNPILDQVRAHAVTVRAKMPTCLTLHPPSYDWRPGMLTV